MIRYLVTPANQAQYKNQRQCRTEMGVPLKPGTEAAMGQFEC